jgi:hypothetical protein
VKLRARSLDLEPENETRDIWAEVGVHFGALFYVRAGFQFWASNYPDSEHPCGELNCMFVDHIPLLQVTDSPREAQNIS